MPMLSLLGCWLFDLGVCSLLGHRGRQRRWLCFGISVRHAELPHFGSMVVSAQRLCFTASSALAISARRISLMVFDWPSLMTRRGPLLERRHPDAFSGARHAGRPGVAVDRVSSRCAVCRLLSSDWATRTDGGSCVYYFSPLETSLSSGSPDADPSSVERRRCCVSFF